ncbi:hypothetical protein DFH09DRAFT_594070 [Mycena vulgaris]|nr:hypothetical protein DFH09DRAFT_594070 [Mycena vulgaris]
MPTNTTPLIPAKICKPSQALNFLASDLCTRSTQTLRCFPVLHLCSHAPSTPRILSSVLYISNRSVVVGHNVGCEPPPTPVLFFSFSFLIHYTPYIILTHHVDAHSCVPPPRCQAGSHVRTEGNVVGAEVRSVGRDDVLTIDAALSSKERGCAWPPALGSFWIPTTISNPMPPRWRPIPSLLLRLPRRRCVPHNAHETHHIHSHLSLPSSPEAPRNSTASTSRWTLMCGTGWRDTSRR